jgi:hypothetical protein
MTIPVDSGSVLAEAADRLADARIAVERLEDARKVAQDEYDKVEAQLFDALEAAGIESIRTERGLFRINDLAWPKVVDADVARAWAEANVPELLTLNHQRLGKLIRDSLKGESAFEGGRTDEYGNILPPGVDFTTSRKITWRRQ